MKPGTTVRLSVPLASSIAALAFAAVPRAYGQSNWTYNGTVAASTTAASNQWGNALSWSGGVPDVVDAVANLTFNITAARTITLDGDRTIGTLAIDDSTTGFFAYNLSAGTPTISRLIFDVSAGSANLNSVTAASTATSTINVPITLNDPLSINWEKSGATNVSSLTLAGAISDGASSYSITKSGNAIATFNAANSYDGGTIISGGRIGAGNLGSYGTGSVAVTSGGQAFLAATGTFTNAFSLAGNGSTLESDAGALVGALRYSNNTTSGPITLTGDARIGAFSATTSGTMNGPLTGTFNLEINSASNASHNGNIFLNGNASAMTGTVTVTQGSVTLGPLSNPGGNCVVRDGARLSGETAIAGSLELGNSGSTTTGATLTFDPSTSAVLAVGGNLTLNGITTVALDPRPIGNGTFPVLSYAGSLTGNDGNLAFAAGNYRPGTGLSINPVQKLVSLNVVSRALVWTGASTSEWNYTDANWLDGANPANFFDLDGVTFNMAGNVTIPSGTAVRTSGATFDLPAGSVLQLSGPGTLTNSPVVKRGAGKLTIGHATSNSSTVNVLTGTSPITIEQGTLAGSSMTPVSANTTITMGSASTGTAPTILEVPASQSTANDFTTLACPLVLSPAAPNSEAIIRYAGGTSNLAPSFSGSIQLNGRDLYLENTSGSNLPTRLYNVSGAVSGTGNVRVRCGTLATGEANGATRVRLTNAGNNFTGDVYIETGSLQIGFTAGSGYIPDSSLVVMSAGTVLSQGNSTETIRGLQGGAATEAVPFTARIDNGSGTTSTMTLTVSDSNAANTHVFHGRIINSSGPMALTKAGAATQVLTGVHAYTGTTLVNGGTLEIGGAGQLNAGTYSGAMTFGAGATFKYNSTADQLLQTGVISGAGQLVKENTSTLTLTAVNTFSGDVTVSGGTLIGAGASNGSGGVSVLGSRTNTRVFTINNGGILQFNSGNILGSNHVQTTAPKLVINSGGVVTNGSIATNNALNDVELNGGTLTSTTGHTGSSAPNLPVYGAWNLNGTVTSTGNSTISTSDPTKGWIMLKVPGDKTTNFNVASGTLTVSAPVVDNPTDGNIGSLSKSGAGTMVLSGVNTYTGNTTVNEGTLALADNAQLKFALGAASGLNNSLTGAGTVTLEGDFVIDTAAANALPSGTWTLEDVSTLTGPYGASFTVAGFVDAGGNKWTKANGATAYTFDENTGILTLAPAATDAYAAWALAGGLDGTAGKEAGKSDDPDRDGRINFSEFAFDGNPLSGAGDGKIVGRIGTVGGNQVMTLTLPVRTGAVFSASSGDQLSAPIDGLTYRIEGDVELGTFANVISEVTGAEATALQTGLPTLSAGWSYRTFRDAGTLTATPKTFLRAKINGTP